MIWGKGESADNLEHSSSSCTLFIYQVQPVTSLQPQLMQPLATCSTAAACQVVTLQWKWKLCCCPTPEAERGAQAWLLSPRGFCFPTSLISRSPCILTRQSNSQTCSEAPIRSSTILNTYKHNLKMIKPWCIFTQTAPQTTLG